jgi:Flp pilus assembly protein TadD
MRSRSAAFLISAATLGAVLLGGCSGGPKIPFMDDKAAADPTDSDLLAIADTTQASGDSDTALALYRQAATAPGSHPEALTRYGGALLRDGKYDYAAGAFREALIRQPDDVDALRGLGIAQLAQNQIGAAEATLEQAVRDDPDPRAVQDLAVLRIFQNEGDEARLVYRKALVRWPDNLDLASDFALFQALTGACGPAAEAAHETAASPFAQNRHVADYALVLAICGHDADAVARQVMSNDGLDRLRQQAADVHRAGSLAAKAAAVGLLPVALSPAATGDAASPDS